MGASVTLTSSTLGEATEADFASWVGFVSDRIDAACGFKVGVDAAQYGESGDDQVRGTDEQRQTIREAIMVLWERWCEGEVAE